MASWAGEGEAPAVPADTPAAGPEAPPLKPDAPATKPDAPPAKPTVAAPSPPPATSQEEVRKEALRARIEKQLAAVQKKFDEVREAESKLSLEIIQVQGKAGEGLDNPGKAEQSLREGKLTDALTRYRQIYLACAAKLIALDPRYAASETMLKPVAHDLDRLADESYTNRVTELADSIWRARRANLERIAGLYSSVADYRSAFTVYMKIYQSLPKDKRDERDVETLKKTVLDLRQKHEKMLEDRKKEEEKRRQQQSSGNRGGNPNR
jgi:hypothetical protein